MGPWAYFLSAGARSKSNAEHATAGPSGLIFRSAGSRSRSKAVRTLVGPRLGSKKRDASEASARAATQKKSQKRNSPPVGTEIP
eukprot:4424478-Pyramimonas_sp.AAC.1